MGMCASGLKKVSAVAPPSVSSESSVAAEVAEQGVRSQRSTKKRRGSVSAESGRPQAARVVHPKDDATRARLQGILADVALFRELDEAQRSRLADAMFERRCSVGQVLIRQGQEGDFFYVVDHGRFVAAQGGQVRRLYDGTGSFGELALLHNCPRAASVTAETSGVVWALDRATFRSCVVEAMESKRTSTQFVLEKVPIFRDLTREQLAAVTDCLATERFDPGEVIVAQGAALAPESKFYVITSGRVDCFRTEPGAGPGAQRQLANSLTAGDVFGEVALLTNAPRQADCVAATRVQCVTLQRDAFERLMGPAEESLSRQIRQYEQLNAAAAAAAAATPAQGAGPARLETSPCATAGSGEGHAAGPAAGPAADAAQSGCPALEGAAAASGPAARPAACTAGGTGPTTAAVFIAAVREVRSARLGMDLSHSPVPLSSPPRVRAQGLAPRPAGATSAGGDGPAARGQSPCSVSSTPCPRPLHSIPEDDAAGRPHP